MDLPQYLFVVPEDFLYRTAMYTVMCFALHYLSDPMIALFFPSTAEWKHGKKVDAYNRLVSSVHAVLMFALTLYYWVEKNPSMNLVGYNIDSLQALTHDAMIGYLVYDTITNYALVATGDNMTMVHHLLGLITHISARLFNSGPASFYYMMVYIAEGSTLPLHVVWFMHALDLKDYPSFKIVCFIVLASYAVLRIMWGPYMLYHLATNYEMWQSNEIDSFLLYPNSIILFLFNLINFFWFHKLITKFLSTTSTTTSSSKKD